MNNRRKMQRRHAMSPTSLEAIRLRYLCETLRQTITSDDVDSVSERDSSSKRFTRDDRRSRTFGAPSA
ncbi:hypothetical protein HJC23_000174 [Cyclotella cryptica]|uniref:Uncharacterized protein n=1 Tax=Cyclotella cryptica TaxID=29204 RepID=A0ABD3QCY4_9STRA